MSLNFSFYFQICQETCVATSGEQLFKSKHQVGISNCKCIHIPFQAYVGWDYAGFVVQEHTEKTIEAEVFKALEKTRLLESRETSNYHRYFDLFSFICNHFIYLSKFFAC